LVDLSFLPHLNATLNALACTLLIIGRVQIMRRRVVYHRRCMIIATVASSLFLVCYIAHYIWRAKITGSSHSRYHGTGLILNLYYAMLLSHIVLAITVPVFAIRLIYLGLLGRYDAHKRIAKIGFPIWVYVSVTGVLIYLMLYWFNPTP